MPDRRTALPPHLSKLESQLESGSDAATAALLRELRAVDRLITTTQERDPKLLNEMGLARMGVIGAGPTVCQCCNRPL